MDSFTPYIILSDTDRSGIFIVTSVKGLTLFTLITIFTARKPSLACSQWTIYVILLFLVMSQALDSLLRHLDGCFVLGISDIYFP